MGSSITHTLVDSRGNIWLGREEGISKFDGTSWTQYTKSNSSMPANFIQTIFEDSKGNFWFGTGYTGVGSLTDDGWSTNKSRISNFNFDNKIFSGGLVKFDGNSWINYNKNEPKCACKFVDLILEDPHGNIWFREATPKGKICMYDGSKFIRFNKETGLITNQAQSYYHIQLLIDKLGNAWVASSGTVSKYDRDKWVNFTSKEGLKIGQYILGLEQDSKGNIWVVSLTK